MLYLCASFDYELFLGGSNYTEKEVLIDPTYAIMDTFNKYGKKLTLFADVCSFLRYRALGLNEFPDMAEKQMAEAIQQGHDVQLHIHPHWSTSNYNNGNWHYDTDHYRIHTYGFDTDKTPNALEIIDEGHEYLSTLLTKASADYKCVAFRAGGYCLQPEQKLLTALKQKGIVIDSSVNSGNYSKNATHFYNYKNVPNCINWWISPTEGIKKCAQEDLQNNVFEIPVGTVKPGLKKLKLKLAHNYLGNPNLKGKTVDDNQVYGKFKKYCNKIEQFLQTAYLLEFDGWDYHMMLAIVAEYLQRFDCENQDYYLAIVGHPKVSSPTLLQNMNHFLYELNARYENKVDVISMRQAYEKLL